jgi:putative sigma-54 modulation protein
MGEKHKSESQAYNVTITGRHVHVTEAMKEYAQDKLSKLERFAPNHIIDVHVTMDIQKLEHRTACELKFGHYKIRVSASTDDMYKSIDKAVERLESKLRKYKVKLQDHHKSALPVVDMKVNVLQTVDTVEEINQEIDEANRRHLEDVYTPHKLVKQESYPVKTLQLGHALMKIELSDDSFMVFRSEEDQKIKVVYKLEDGNFGILSPE